MNLYGKHRFELWKKHLFLDWQEKKVATFVDNIYQKRLKGPWDEPAGCHKDWYIVKTTSRNNLV